jgi:hypothetical protein
MLITAETKVLDALKEHPELKEVLIRLNPKFSRLNNKFVLNTVGRWARFRDVAARMEAHTRMLLLGVRLKFDPRQYPEQKKKYAGLTLSPDAPGDPRLVINPPGDLKMHDVESLFVLKETRDENQAREGQS